MKKKIGTVIEEDLLLKAKECAARQGKPLADVIQEALDAWLQGSGSNADALRAAEQFCSHGSALGTEEIDELLGEDLLAL